MPLARLRGARLPLLRDETACRWAGGAEKQHCYQESRSWAPARSIVENRSLPRRGRRCGSSGLGAGSLWTGRKVPGEGVLSSENRNTQGCLQVKFTTPRANNKGGAETAPVSAPLLGESCQNCADLENNLCFLQRSPDFVLGLRNSFSTACRGSKQTHSNVPHLSDCIGALKQR